MSKALADAINDTLSSPSECCRNLEKANVVDGLFFVGRKIGRGALRMTHIAEAIRILAIASSGATSAHVMRLAEEAAQRETEDLR